MWSRRILAVLLVFSMILSVAADPVARLDDQGLPSKEFTYALMQSNPELVWDMVRKLYVLERALPVIALPDLTIIRTTDGQVIVGYAEGAEGTLFLGTPTYNTEYIFNVKQSVVVGVKPEPVFKWHWTYTVASGVVVFAVGLVTGILVR